MAKFARDWLPRISVPVFIRIAGGKLGERANHNNKLIKGPLRRGCSSCTERTKVEGVRKDRVLWLPPNENTYVDFGQADRNALGDS